MPWLLDGSQETEKRQMSREKECVTQLWSGPGPGPCGGTRPGQMCSSSGLILRHGEDAQEGVSELLLVTAQAKPTPLREGVHRGGQGQPCSRSRQEGGWGRISGSQAKDIQMDTEVVTEEAL